VNFTDTRGSSCPPTRSRMPGVSQPPRPPREVVAIALSVGCARLGCESPVFLGLVGPVAHDRESIAARYQSRDIAARPQRMQPPRIGSDRFDDGEPESWSIHICRCVAAERQRIQQRNVAARLP